MAECAAYRVSLLEQKVSGSVGLSIALVFAGFAIIMLPHLLTLLLFASKNESVFDSTNLLLDASRQTCQLLGSS